MIVSGACWRARGIVAYGQRSSLILRLHQRGSLFTSPPACSGWWWPGWWRSKALRREPAHQPADRLREAPSGWRRSKALRAGGAPAGACSPARRQAPGSAARGGGARRRSGLVVLRVVPLLGGSLFHQPADRLRVACSGW